MTPQLLLEKIIEKAVKNGWDEKKAKSIKEWIYEKDETWGTFLQAESLDTILFDHSFAKAYFGEEWPEDFSTVWGERLPDIYWHYEIQQLALTPPEERLSYLEHYI